MAWHWWMLVAVFLYFSAGFAYFPIFDRCANRIRSQWLLKMFMRIFLPAAFAMLVAPGVVEVVLTNIERSPGTPACRRFQKCLFWIVFGLPLLWMSAVGLVGWGIAKALRILDKYEDILEEPENTEPR